MKAEISLIKEERQRMKQEIKREEKQVEALETKGGERHQEIMARLKSIQDVQDFNFGKNSLSPIQPKKIISGKKFCPTGIPS